MSELIVYFSRKYENYVSGEIKNLEIGNTEVAAGIIQKLTGADMFKIEPVQAYSKDYNECIAQAQADQKRNARPELKSYPQHLNYSKIYLCYPSYWGTMPWQYLRFWSILILQGKRSNLSALMRGAGWAAA